MPLETATGIPDLVSANPAHPDGMGQGDAHLRLIKSVLQNTFKNFTGGASSALNSTQAQIDAAVNLLTGASGVAAFPAGTIAAPSIAFTGDPDSGWSKPAEDQWALSLNAIQQALFTTTAVTLAQPVTTPALTANGAAGINASAGPYAGGTGQLVPTGAIFCGLYPSSAPTGYLFLNGQLVSRTTYAALFALWGTTYGVGDGSTTFGLPDWRDITPVGQGTMGGTVDRGLIAASGPTANINTLGSQVGEAKHTLTLAEAPTGQFTFNDATHTHNYSLTGFTGKEGGNAGNAWDVTLSTAATSATATGASITDHAGGGAHNIVQLGIACQWIVKT